MWECKDCGQENEDSLPNCMSCGLESGQAPPEPTVPAAPARPANEPASPWEITRKVAGVVSFLGWMVLIVGLVAAPIMLIVVDTRSDRMGEFLLALVLQTLGAALVGLVLVLIGHVARAVVDTTENSGRIVEILESEGGRPPDRTA